MELPDNSRVRDTVLFFTYFCKLNEVNKDVAIDFYPMTLNIKNVLTPLFMSLK